MIIFNSNEPIKIVRAHVKQERTMLIASFQLNRDDPLAYKYIYQDAPLHFVWDWQNKE
jgi:hypothetical protein